MIYRGIPSCTRLPTRISIRNLFTSSISLHRNITATPNPSHPKRNNEQLDIDHNLINDDNALLDTILNEESGQGSQDHELKGTQYWRKQYGKQINKVNRTLNQRLESHLKKNMGAIKSYNETYKKAPIDRVKIDLSKEDLKFGDYYKNDVLLRCLRSYLTSDTPTDFQKRLLSLTSSYLSTIAKGDQGSGRSLALIIHALFLKRSRRRGPGITSLLILRSNEAVIQYRKIINDIYLHLPESQRGESAKLAQFLYRSDKDTEAQQQKTLAMFPTPHILVTTPNRLLDLLSSRGMDFVKVNSLPFIAVDDFDTMVDVNNFLGGKTEPPVVQLLNYVVKLQDYRRSHNEPHPQIIFTVSACTSDSLLEEIKEGTKWFDWNKFVPMGSFESAGELPYTNYIPSNVGLSTVLINPDLSNEKTLKLTLTDMVKFEYGDDIRVWLDKLYRTSKGHDAYYQRERKIKRASITKEVKKIELVVLVGGLVKLVMGKNSDLKGKKALIVHSDEVNGFNIQQFLFNTNIPSRIYNVNRDADFFTQPITEEENTQFLTINSSALSGLTFKGLDNIILLGMDSIKSAANFVSVGGRFRDADSSPIDDSLYKDFGSVIKDSAEVPPEKRIFLLSSKFDFTHSERNFIERLCIRSGLIKQFGSVGSVETEFDKLSYEREFSGDYQYSLHDGVSPAEVMEYSEELEKNYKE
ncbi:hypothetical protein CANARDRAFT_7577 [[Candida] arabinofermentans NRRL YB-2248]|uniref:ATP-dependent RNA helicase n=1 Tax=[Candida] arabinofermentans NRRL YB-2248 TaxID=983967 RepID=A0A1E4T153_9ASCO|nr:hypothetical protein CANARDRAFT_7577 [[Candida] arabinofermentans NRRL YB-2248]